MLAASVSENGAGRDVCAAPGVGAASWAIDPEAASRMARRRSARATDSSMITFPLDTECRKRQRVRRRLVGLVFERAVERE